MINRKQLFIIIIAALIYLSIALILFYPLIGNPTKTVIGTPSGDIYQFLFFMWWIKYSLLSLHVSPYAHMSLLYYPIGTNSALLTIAPIAGIISIPFQAVSLQFAYNIMFFLGFVVAGLGAFVLSYHVTKDQYAAVLGGIFFSFSSAFIAGSAAEFQLFGLGLIPFFLYFFLRSMDEKKLSLMLISGILLMSIAFADTINEFLITIIAAILVLIFVLLDSQNEKQIKKYNNVVEGLKQNRPLIFLFIVTIALISGVWGFAPLLHSYLTNYGTITGIATTLHTVEYSLSVMSFFLPNYIFARYYFQSPASSHYNLLFSQPIGGAAFVGYSLLCLVIYALVKDFKNSRIWVACAVVFALISLGPYIHLASTIPITTYGLPYILLSKMPLFNTISEPQSFAPLTALFLAVSGAVGFAAISRNLLKNKRLCVMVLVCVISIVFVLESFGIPHYNQTGGITTNPYAPTFFSNIANESVNGSFMVLPTSIYENYLYSGMSDYYVTKLDKPSLTGLVTRLTPEQSFLVTAVPLINNLSCEVLCGNESYPWSPYYSPVSENYTVQSIAMLKNYNVSWIVIENNVYGSELNLTLKYMRTVFGNQIYSDSNVTLFSTVNSTKFLNNTVVAVPESNWLIGTISLASKNLSGWIPLNYEGNISTYSFYQNNTSTSTTYSQLRVSFYAISAYGQQYLKILVHQNEDDSNSIYSEELNQNYTSYYFNTTVENGNGGNQFVFETQYNDSVLINNITFSKIGDT